MFVSAYLWFNDFACILIYYNKAREWLRNDFSGPVFMAVGMKDPVLGPPVMQVLRNDIRNCPEPLEIHEAGHFVQEWGGEVATKALTAFEQW